jgi:hypothetical protein
MANLVCEATRRVALDGATSALQAVAGRSPQVADVVHDIAEPLLSRATIMQIEIDCFMAAARRCRHGAKGSAAAAAERRSTSTAARRPAEAPLRRARE